MKTSGLIVTLCALVLSASATAQTPPAPNAGQALTQEYAALYREYLDKKKLGLDADAQTKYGEFLTAFRKHRLLARGIVSAPSGPPSPGDPGGVPTGVANPNGGSTGGDTGGGSGTDTQPPTGGGDTGGGETGTQELVPNPGDGGLSPTAPATASTPPPGDGGIGPDGGDTGGDVTSPNN